jgi:hypothetical protein
MFSHAGEKRKRKLQYLQQLITDGSNDEQTPDTSPRQRDAHLRSLSTDYDAGPSSPYLLPAHSEYAPMSTNEIVGMGPASTATTASFDHHLLPTTQSYPPYSSSWASPIYDPPPPTNMTWNVPAWMPSVDYSPRVAPRPETFRYSPPLGARQPIFDQTPSPYHRPRDLAPNTDHYALASSYRYYDGSQSQTPAISSVSLPTPTSYFQGHYPGPH